MSDNLIAHKIIKRRPGKNGRYGKPGRPAIEHVEARMQEVTERADEPVEPWTNVEKLLGRELSARERMGYVLSHSWRELF